MLDQVRKAATIYRINSLQLPPTLITALDNAHDAEAVVEAIHTLLHFSQHWN